MKKPNATQLHERIRAAGMLAGDMVERLLHEALALLNSVTHEDLASFISRLDSVQLAQRELAVSLEAVARQHAELLAEVRYLRGEVHAMYAGLQVERAVSTSEAEP